MQYVAFLGIGIVTGIFSGIFGIGGGVVLVPLLVLALGFSQHAASGTSLVALLLPVGALGAYQYYQVGKISNDNIRAGLLLAIGIFFGTYFGSRISIGISEKLLVRLFSGLLAALALRMWFLPR